MTKLTSLEEEAHTARMMVEASGKKAFVLIAEINGNEFSVTRSISDGTTRNDGAGWIAALNRERDRIGKLLGVDPDSVGYEAR